MGHCRDLPIYDIESKLVDAFRDHPRLILTAPTGSGKSTQVPQILLDHDATGGGLMVLQPRRLAARMLASRVARERDGRLGDEVGYQVRLERAVSAATRITYVTEGILLRRLSSDPILQGVGGLVFDEFHERHLYGDVSLARALQLQRSTRPDLKIVVMSATLDVGALAGFLDPCAQLHSEGRTFPVEIEYARKRIDPTKTPVWDAASATCEQALQDGAAGNILIFMPGAYEIRRTLEGLRRGKHTRALTAMALHGELPSAEQDAAVAASPDRRIVVATNVAETSITIEGVETVIDCGLARVPDFDPHRGINTLAVQKISRASADQRTGRAGRTAPGRCYRLWTEKEQRERPVQEIPEIQRLDLSEIFLMLAADEFTAIDDFPWLDPPRPEAMTRAQTLLADLGAVDPATGNATALGKRMAAFPLHPRYARMLLAGEQFDCVHEAASVAALTQGRNILIRNPGVEAMKRRESEFRDQDVSDWITLFDAYSYAKRHRFSVGPCSDLGIHAQSARQVEPLSDSFLRMAKVQGLAVNEFPAGDEAVRKCILVGFVDQLARRLNRGSLRCEVVHGRRGDLVRESVVRNSDLVVAAEIDEIEGKKRERNVLLQRVSAVEEKWLDELFPGEVTKTNEVKFDQTGKRVVSVRRRKFRGLVLDQRPGGDPSPDRAAELLAEGVLDGRFTLKMWDHGIDQWIHRMNLLHRACPDLGFPAFTGEDRRFLVTQVCHGAFSAKDIRDRPIRPVLKGWLEPGMSELLETVAPERLQLPGGRRSRITYSENGTPEISARIQDLYDVKAPLTIAYGRIRLRIQILAPNQRPVQVTEDPAGFWRDTYPSVKKELQKKYPKHEWR